MKQILVILFLIFVCACKKNTDIESSIPKDITIAFSGNNLNFNIASPIFKKIGSTIAITVTPNAGYIISNIVEGTCNTGTWSGSTYTTSSLTSDCSITFSALPQNVVVTINNSHVISSPSGNQTITNGSNLSLTLTPDSGYELSTTVTGTCPTGSWSGNVYTVNSITNHCTLNFSGTPVYTLTSSGTNVTISPSSSQIVSSGATKTYNLTSNNSNYDASTVVAGSCPSGSWNGSNYTTGSITSDCSVIFSRQEWTSSKQIGTSTVAMTTSGIGTDSNGNVYVSGTATGGGVLGTPRIGTGVNSYLIKYNPSGNIKWIKIIGSTTNADVNAFYSKTDSNGNTYITGWSNGDFNNQTSINYNKDVFVTKIDSSGNFVWTKIIDGTSSGSIVMGIAIDSNSNVYVSGRTYGNIGGTTKLGSVDAFVLKLNSSGVLQWTQNIGGVGGTAYGNAVSVDTSGNVYLVGQCNVSLDGSSNVCYSFMVKFNSSGSKQWTLQTADASLNSIAIDSLNNLYVGGYTNSNIFNSQSKIGNVDLVLAKYSSSGVPQWTKLHGVTSKTTQGSSIYIDTSDNIFIGGYTNGSIDGHTLIGSYDSVIFKYDISGTKLSSFTYGESGKIFNVPFLVTDYLSNTFFTKDTSSGLDGKSPIGSQDSYIYKLNSTGVKQ